jgi:hypothetical protein
VKSSLTNPMGFTGKHGKSAVDYLYRHSAGQGFWYYIMP